MTLQAVLDLYDRFLLYDLDDSSGAGSTPTTDQKLVSVNNAQRQIARMAELFEPSIALTLTADQSTYDLRSLSVVAKKVVRPFHVLVNGVALWNCARTERGLWTMEEIQREAPSWRTDSSGTPTKAVQYRQGRLIIHPKPTAAVVSAGNNYIAGTYLPTDMTSGQLASEPELPEELHEAVAYLAAVKSALPFVSEGEGWQRLTAYNGEWAAAVDEIRRDNRRLIQSWGSTGGYAWTDTIRL